MPRPTTKEMLLEAADTQFTKLWALIDSMPKDDQTKIFLFEDRDKNIRDILIHLYEWHQLLSVWIDENRIKENQKAFLPEPYNWRTYPDMNVKFWKKHQKTPYAKSIEMLKKSHKEVIALISKFSNEELFTKKYFSWTGTTTLGSYCISATSSHYDWAMKKIKTQIKSLKSKD